MGNKKERNEALLAALTKFMAWTGEQAPTAYEYEYREIKKKLDNIDRWLTAISSSLESYEFAAPELQDVYLSAVKEAIKAAQKECNL